MSEMHLATIANMFYQVENHAKKTENGSKL